MRPLSPPIQSTGDTRASHSTSICTLRKNVVLDSIHEYIATVYIITKKSALSSLWLKPRASPAHFGDALRLRKGRRHDTRQQQPALTKRQSVVAGRALRAREAFDLSLTSYLAAAAASRGGDILNKKAAMFSPERMALRPDVCPAGCSLMSPQALSQGGELVRWIPCLEVYMKRI